MQRIENRAPAHGVKTKLEITAKEPLVRFEFIAKLSQQTTRHVCCLGLVYA